MSPEATRTRPHVVLVGKGITFDSGGLSLKTAEGMMTMKTDMTGAAIVLGAISAAARLGATAKVTAIAPITENLPGHRAMKPGDVLTARNGATIEVLNTDAEGRLVLADGLSLAAELAARRDHRRRHAHRRRARRARRRRRARSSASTPSSSTRFATR